MSDTDVALVNDDFHYRQQQKHEHNPSKYPSNHDMDRVQLSHIAIVLFPLTYTKKRPQYCFYCLAKTRLPSGGLFNVLQRLAP